MKDMNQATYLIAAQEADVEAIHHMLSVTLAEPLRNIYNRTLKSGMQSFEDTIDDFLLFLYHGPKHMSDAGLPPFSLLLRVEHSSSLYKWVTSAYRIRLRQTMGTGSSTLSLDNTDFQIQSAGLLPDNMLDNENEGKRHELCDAIAICISQSDPLGRFIILRWLLTVLEPDKAIPQAPMAKAIGITHSNYRVSTKRQKDRLRHTMETQHSKSMPPTDAATIAIRNNLICNSNHLYDCLTGYYDRCIAELPQSAEIEQLRNRLSQDAGHMLHDPEHPESSVQQSVLMRAENSSGGQSCR